jgi:hypothetical protein
LEKAWLGNRGFLFSGIKYTGHWKERWGLVMIEELLSLQLLPEFREKWR